MTRKTNIELVAWVVRLIGQPYWFGTCSYAATNSLLTRKRAQYPSHYRDNRLARYRKDIAAAATVQDCVGIIKGYYWTREDGKMIYLLDGRPDKGANSMFAAAKHKGPIATMPEVPGVILHMHGHVGVYIGDGWVVEAKGFSSGVIKSRIEEGKWTSWFYCPYIEYVLDEDGWPEIEGENGDQIPETPVNRRILFYRTDKPMMRGEDVTWVQTLLTMLMFEPGAIDGYYGPNTRNAVVDFQSGYWLDADGIVGPKTWAAMESITSILSVELAEYSAPDPVDVDSIMLPWDTDPEDSGG